MCEYLKTSSKLHHGLTPMQLRKLAFQYARMNNKKVPESWIREDCAGYEYEWYRSFMDRNKTLSLRTPEATSLNRAISFNKHNVNMFFENLECIYKEEKLGPQCMWNIDETGFTTVHKPPKIVAIKGEKQVGTVTSSERGELVTDCAAVNGAGNHIPPYMVFPR